MQHTKTATKIGASAAIAAAALIATATGASAATLNGAGSGFVGKGEVQSAFGWNNAKMQGATATGFTFSTTQGAAQALFSTVTESATQDGTQSGTQDGTQLVTQRAKQDMVQVLSCTKTNGSIDQRFRTGNRDGEKTATRTTTRTAERTAERTGNREGDRSGTRSGSLVGSLNADILYTTKGKTDQWTGFNLKGYAQGDPRFSVTGTEQFDAAQFDGDYNFGEFGNFGEWSGIGEFGNFGDYSLGDYAFGATTWDSEDFVAAPGNNDPDGVCKEGASNVVPGSVSLVTVPGDIHEGDVSFGDVTPGAIHEGDTLPGAVHVNPKQEFGPTEFGAVTSTGPASLSVTYSGSTKPLTITAPAV